MYVSEFLSICIRLFSCVFSLFICSVSFQNACADPECSHVAGACIWKETRYIQDLSFFPYTRASFHVCTSHSVYEVSIYLHRETNLIPSGSSGRRLEKKLHTFRIWVSFHTHTPLFMNIFLFPFMKCLFIFIGLICRSLFIYINPASVSCVYMNRPHFMNISLFIFKVSWYIYRSLFIWINPANASSDAVLPADPACMWVGLISWLYLFSYKKVFWFIQGLFCRSLYINPATKSCYAVLPADSACMWAQACVINVVP